MKKFYKRHIKDFLLNTVVMGMTLEEEGAYNRLLDIWWHEGGVLPNNNATLAKLVGKGCTEEIIKNIKICFIPDKDNNLIVPLLMDQLPKKKEKATGPSDNYLIEECAKHTGIFSASMIKEFINYWSEEFVKGPYKGRQRWQGEDTWDTKKRLATWQKNEARFNPTTKGQPAPTDNKLKGSIHDKIRRQNERE